MLNALRLLPVACAALALCAGTAAHGQNGEGQEAPQPLPAISIAPPPEPHPADHYWTAADFNDALSDCFDALREDNSFDKMFLASRNWRHAYDTSISGIPNAGTMPVAVYSRGLLQIALEQLPRGETCHVVGRVRDEDHFWEIVGQFPASLGTETFDNHDGHQQVKADMLRSLGEQAKPFFQFNSRTFLGLQVMQSSSVRTMMSVKIIPVPA